MNISVLSPQAHNTGNTTLAILVALEMANRGNKVCLTHANSESASFYEYFNLRNFEDKTSTPSLVVKLLKENAIVKDEIHHYCKKVTENLEVFSNNSKNFTSEDMQYMLKYIGTNFPHDHIVFDIDIGIYDIPGNAVTRDIILNSDIVVLSMSQAVQRLRVFETRKKDILEVIGKKPIVVVINKFNEISASVKEVAQWMGIKKPNNWLLMRYNPWVDWGTNHGQIVHVFEQMKKRDTRVIDVATDLEKIGGVISKISIEKGNRKAGA